MIAYLLQFAGQHHLEAHRDEVGNVIIRKPATKGFENCKTVVLQSHLDMVCEKNNDVKHDFMSDAIEAYMDGDWLRANGTTLGADNGIGIATELAILAADDLQHGPIECVFTEDEETGMTGSEHMSADFMQGEILLNLDSEEEGEFCIGCAGGVNTTALFSYSTVEVPASYYCFSVGVNGLTGGHSGDDINKNRANANKLLTRFLLQLQQEMPFCLCRIDGGNLHNAIPREAMAVCAVPMGKKEQVRILLNIFSADTEKEFCVTEPNMHWWLQSEEAQTMAIDADTTRRLLLALQACANGVFAMSQDIPGLVETSNNLASVKMKEDNGIEVLCSQRSSLSSAKQNVADAVGAVFRLAGAKVTVGDGYPGWSPNPASPILQVAIDSYRRLFGKEPIVKAIHAGLECGLLSEKYPKMDMLSFGPTMLGVHSPDERLQVSTVEKFWLHLTDMLRHIPQR